MPDSIPTAGPGMVSIDTGQPIVFAEPDAPLPAEGLRERVAETLLDPLKCCIVAPFPLTPIHGTCKDCWTKALAAADAVLAALAGDPGDLPARMAGAIGEALNQWGRPDAEGTRGVRRWDFIAAAALSVRLEHAAHLAARVGDAERRAEHAEGEHQVTQDRLAEARAKLDRVILGRTQAQLDRNAAKAERDALKAAIGDLIGKAKPRTVYAPKRVIDAADLAALIDAPGGAQ